MKPAHPTLLLLSLAYTAGRSPQSPAGSLHSLAAAGEAASYTTPWTDSSRLGDTVFHSSGRVITTVAVHTDSLWAVRPPAEMVKGGLPYGPTQLPADSLCTLGYTARTLRVVAKEGRGELERTHDWGGGTFIQIRRAKLKNSDGNLSV